MAIEGINEEEIFRNAIQYEDRDEQVKYVKQACGNDTKLYEAVESLLKHHNEGSILDSPAFEATLTHETTPVTEGPGARIGRYKLLEKIGEGGMAVVYMAEQKEPIRRRVALKIIKLGMDTKSVIARFEAERQALALMDHPNIAKVLDAGSTESGRPYFVMDIVPGLPITEYCDKNRLDIEQRLNLFIQICNAVQHAHQKGIIHRDIKPSNIIVTMHDGEPVPKVIDFGIAKATNQRLTEKTLFTRHAQIIGTPAYMSPEQAELSDWDVDTRTDIYSLGILLYELLTGTTPFGEEQLREASYLQMQKIICETEPTKPSTKLSTLGEALTDVAKWHNCSPELMPKLIRGDLDWIVMKTLEKNRTRRYDTADALAADIQRHLNSEPVVAAAPSIFYTLRKFTKRHRVAVLAGVFIVIALLFTAVISAIYAVEMDEARQETTAMLAASYVDQAQSLSEQGHIGRGMLWLAHSLEIAPEESRELRRAIRTSLAAWHSQAHLLRSVVQYAPLESPPLLPSFSKGPDGTYKMTDSGEDIWGTADQFHFAYRTLSGPGSIVARIDNIKNTHDWAKAGIMIRESLKAGSKHALIGLTPGNGVFLQYRPYSDAGCQTTQSTDINTPHWVKLDRDAAGNFTASHSADGTTWKAIQNSLQIKIPMNEDVYIGLALTSHNPNEVCEAVFSNIRTTGSVTAEWKHQAIGIQTDVTERIHSNRVNDVAVSPDGSRIFAACRDGKVRLSGGDTGEQIGEPLIHGSEVVAVTISLDGKLIATGGSDGSVRLWDADTLESIGEPMQHATRIVMAFSPDSSCLVTAGNDGAVRFWDAHTGKALSKGFQHKSESRWHSVRAVAFCPEGVRVVIRTGWSKHQMFDAESGNFIGPPIVLSKTVAAVAISPDGKRFLTGDGGGKIQIWDAATGEQVQEPISHGGVTYALTYSPDGSQIASGGASRMARLWDAASGESIGGPMRQRNTVTTIAFSSDGSYIITGNQDGVVERWDLVQKRHTGKTVESQGRICGAVFNKGDLWILTQIGDMVQFRDAVTGEPIGQPFAGSKWIILTALSPEGSILVTQRAWRAPELRMRSVATGELLGEVRHREPHCVVFSPDCSIIITGGEDNIARLWDVKTLRCITEFHQFQGTVQDAAFSPDGTQFLIGSFDGTTRLWDTNTLKEIGEPIIHQSEVKGLAYSPDGKKILIGFADGTIRLYDSTTHNPIGTPLQHVELVCSVDYSPDGLQLLACSIDGTARLWDAATLKPIGPPLKHGLGWSNASFNPVDSRILIHSRGSAQVWPASSVPLDGESDRILCWVQVVTGMELDSTGGINVLDAETWNQRRQLLKTIGGPPKRNSVDFSR